MKLSIVDILTAQMQKYLLRGVLILLLFNGCATSLVTSQSQETLPDGFVYLETVDPTIIQEMRYAGVHNFIGNPIVGYLAPRCILSQKAATALAKVQKELMEYSMSLKVYECYRPQRAVDSFVKWATRFDDTKMKQEFYPEVDKRNLFKDGYIAEKSGHSRGSTVDLTVIPFPVPTQAQYKDGDRLEKCFLPVEKRFKDNTLDFGTGFDCFDPLAHTANPAVGIEQKRNRVMLKSMMEKNGFKNLAEEWWHYTLKDEPFPSTYFDFLVK